MKTQGSTIFSIFLITTGSLFGIWAAAALIGGLYRVNWEVTELARQYLVASGMIKPIHTVVDFYTHIKGIEYILCLICFVAFPLFFKYVNERKVSITSRKKTSQKNR
ncbi:hypothetical protein [Desulforhopalus singaporensis]|uniref:Uncharacterized protein n=1 Tax=Desulforhopalus singaporensis TaxID=91360 RepID=A0A1H0S4P9_9BACT|nr:hypothetical protein [Desulforhopalus singaporensis]SDP36647.1 hypothetical protein SAMN05660330_02533 [Desulforhopalus singaporensis]